MVIGSESYAYAAVVQSVMSDVCCMYCHVRPVVLELKRRRTLRALKEALSDNGVVRKVSTLALGAATCVNCCFVSFQCLFKCLCDYNLFIVHLLIMPAGSAGSHHSSISDS